jgi:hypothetical protein
LNDLQKHCHPVGGGYRNGHATSLKAIWVKTNHVDRHFPKTIQNILISGMMAADIFT